jgi:Uma2 family endonuclease
VSDSWNGPVRKRNEPRLPPFSQWLNYIDENGTMAAVAGKLTIEEFESKYGRSERSYEYWYGEAVPKAMPTWIHTLLQGIIIKLLIDEGYKSGPELELRIDPDAHPRPDIVATKGKIEIPYPTKAVDVVIEILSNDDPMPYVLQKCRAYQTWGFAFIYVVDPEGRVVYQWTGQGLAIADSLTSIPALRIWAELDKALES